VVVTSVFDRPPDLDYDLAVLSFYIDTSKKERHSAQYLLITEFIEHGVLFARMVQNLSFPLVPREPGGAQDIL
jgi:hypothetical protein